MTMPKYSTFLIAITIALTAAFSAAADADPAQAARDSAIVQALLRLKKVDVASNPKFKAAVLRHLATQQGTPRYLELVEAFRLTDVNDELLRLAIVDPASTSGVSAARLLLSFEAQDDLKKVFAGGDKKAAASLVAAVGQVANTEAIELLSPMVTEPKYSVEARTAAVRGLGRNRNGEKLLLNLVTAGELPKDLTFVAGDVLHASADPAVREEVAKYIELPATAAGEPLPTISELVKQSGEAARGHKVFATIGTCAKCHVIGKEGKEVGPSLSEIGSKLSREAMYVAILDPSAGISHNYESYSVVTLDGKLITGIKLSETDEAITLKTAEAIVREIKQEDIDEITKQKVSLMPAGLQKVLKVQDLVDLVEYLTTLKKKS